MNKREWLAERGLAEIGKRGRFSREAEAAWAEHNSGVVIQAKPEGEIPIPTQEVIPESHYDGFRLARRTPPEKLPVRKENCAYAIDERGTIIAYSNCHNCKERISYCECVPGPQGPSYLPKQTMYTLIREES